MAGGVMKSLTAFIAALLFFPITWAAPQETRSAVDQVLAQAPKTAWFSEGQSKRIVYVFFDPNCAGCNFLYKSLRSFVQSGQVSIRWIPVAVVNETSLGKAAAILQAKDPIAALARNEEHYQMENGGIEEDIPDAVTEQRLHANTRLLSELPVPVVPTMVFADRNGNAVLIQGALSPLALRKVFAQLPGAY
ncbi:MAG: hypothetical protein ABS93_02020 [Thiobacillus sp. SCN 62-729]|nr:MAG: hypothetical protein ABS93_02020 [Thiobacillus sp. SCN 62-729]